MNVYKNDAGRWLYRKWVRFPDGHRERVCGAPAEYGFANTKAGAQAAFIRKMNDIAAGQPARLEPVQPKPKGPTLTEFKPRFLEHSEAKNKSSSVESKKQILKTHIEPVLGNRVLRTIDYSTIEDFKHGLLSGAKPLSAKTVNNVLTVLHRLLVVAKKRKEVDEVPEFEWLPVEKPEFDFFTFDEAPRLVEGAVDDWATMILLALRTGMRQGELLGLQWGDVDLIAGKLQVKRALVRGKVTTPKNGKSRDIPLSDEAVRALKSHRHLRGDWVFCTMDGRPLKKSECKWPLWSACKRAGLRRIGWHVLRHTFASHLAMRGVPLLTIKELLGHATIQMTMRYAHLAPEVARDAVRLLDFSGQPVADGPRRAHTERDKA